jgi:hypothetical protein
VYETVEDDEQLSYIKLINLQSKVICNRIYGKMAQKIVGFLMAIHTGLRHSQVGHGHVRARRARGLRFGWHTCRRSTNMADARGPL